jgi:apolipoprotein D and lipocalin family protein
MRNSIAAVILGVVVLAAMGCTSTGRTPDAPATVSQVDLNRYAGVWYQIARYPHFFQRRECAISTARYSIRDDGRVAVRNDCWADELNGTSRQHVTAVARPIDDTNSWLKVRFFGLFTADYLIIELDADYRWAVVTTPDMDTLWILSRTPALEEQLFQSIIDRLEARGFEREKIIRTSGQ